MENLYSLYIDHQRVARLVRSLEQAVTTCRIQQNGQYEPSDIRIGVYRHFLELIHKLFLETNPQLKNEDGSIKLEALNDLPLRQHQQPSLGAPISTNCAQPAQRRNRGPSTKTLEVDLMLIQWIKSCGQCIFEKKELDEKYHELLGDAKRNLTLKKIKEIVERFELPALVVRTRNKQEHFFGVSLNTSKNTNSMEAEEDSHLSWHNSYHGTANNSTSHLEEVKQEPNSCEEASEQLNRTQRKEELPRSISKETEEEPSKVKEVEKRE